MGKDSGVKQREMRKRQSYLVTARLPLGLIASRSRQVSEHAFLRGTHTIKYTLFFFFKREKPQERMIGQEGGK